MKEISLHIMDIVQNSITAGAKNIRVLVGVDRKADELRVEIADDGCGMDGELLARVTSPFTTTRTTRKVGLGIPLFKAGCERTGGSFDIKSAPGKGTTVTAVYRFSNIDRPPMGDLAETLHTLVESNPDLDFMFETKSGQNAFVCSTEEIKQKLDGVPVNEPEVSLWLIGYLQEGIHEIFGGNFE